MQSVQWITIQSSSEPRLSQTQSKKKSHSSKKKKRIQSKQSLQHDSSSSSEFDQSKCLKENQLLLNYYNKKQCQICHKSSNQNSMYLCDKCEDGYHSVCLNIQEIHKKEMWICPTCEKQEKEALNSSKNIQTELPQSITNKCAKCQLLIQSHKTEQVYFDQGLESIRIGFQNESSKQKCLYCKKIFHSECFNIRYNALNCSDCESLIRTNCPKGHKKFLEYYQNKYKNFKQNKYLTLTPLPKNMQPKQTERYPKLSLKLPTPVTNWQFITQYEASIYYAFETKRLNFIQDQIYENEQIRNLNMWNREYVPVLQLHEDDEKIFEIFKQNTTNGVIVGPYEIKEDKIKGFHIVATDFIQKMTIITEYVGEVVSSRKALFHHKENDSVFILIRNPRSCLSLDIVPQKFGNISRFFSGINNRVKESRRLLNVQVRRFSYKGRVRILFYAAKDIQAGDQLFFDYNGGPFHQYPTENFKV